MCGWPPARKDLSACRQLKVACGHVSGLWSRPVAEGPDGFRGIEALIKPAGSRCPMTRDRYPSTRRFDRSSGLTRGCHHASSPSQVLVVQSRVSLFDQRAVSPSRPDFRRAPRAAAVKTGRRPPPQAARSGLDGGEHVGLQPTDLIRGVRLQPGWGTADPAVAGDRLVGASSPPNRCAPSCWRARRRRPCAPWSRAI